MNLYDREQKIVHFFISDNLGMEAISVSYFGFRKKYVSFGLLTSFAVVSSFLLITACTDSAKAKTNFVHKDPPKPGVVAKIGEKEITLKALIGNDEVDFFDLEKRRFDLMMDRLNKLLVEELI